MIDAFRLADGRDAVVVVDRLGNLHLLDEGVPGSLPPALRAELGQHELVRGRPVRRLLAGSFSLLLLERVDQPLNTPGANDPVALSGRLFGPFGLAGSPRLTEGTLTVTRGDLLSGLVDGAREALMTSGVDGHAARCLHMLLPGDTVEATAAKDGLVLAYPLPPAELLTEPTNEAAAAQILADVLAGLQADQQAAGVTSVFAGRELPVASRADLERELERQGWEIRGESAVRLDARLKKGISGLLTSVLGVPDHMTRRLPSEGSLDDFLAIAAEALASMPEWPDARARALRALAAPPAPLRIPSPGDAHRPPPTPPRPAAPPQPATPRQALPQDWRADFGTPTPRSTELRPAKSKVRPDWMDDFE